jgi:hypothetical protein
MMEGHISGISSTFPLLAYRATARADIPMDGERTQQQNILIMLWNFVLGILECNKHGDRQKVGGYGAEALALISHGISEIEALRVATNQRCPSLLERRTRETTGLNPYTQGFVYDAQRQTLAINALMGRAQAAMNADGRFFPTGGSGEISSLSASPPSDPILLAALTIPPGLPIPAVTPLATTGAGQITTAAPSTSHTNDPPRQDDYRRQNRSQDSNPRNNQRKGDFNKSFNRNFNKGKRNRNNYNNNGGNFNNNRGNFNNNRDGHSNNGDRSNNNNITSTLRSGYHK